MENSIVFILPVLDWKYSFWANLVQKIKNCQFMLKFCTKSNSDVQNLMVISIFCLRPEIPIFGKLAPENQTCQFKLKFDLLEYRKFTFSVFDQKYPFWANFVQKSKIVCSK